jgi:hypothetical protein
MRRICEAKPEIVDYRAAVSMPGSSLRAPTSKPIGFDIGSSSKQTASSYSPTIAYMRASVPG